MNRLEEWWNSADDGAFAPIGPMEIRAESEFEGLMDAWYLERQNCIECEILLEQSRALIVRLISELEASPSRRRQARLLIRAIDHTLKSVEARDD